MPSLRLLLGMALGASLACAAGSPDEEEDVPDDGIEGNDAGDCTDGADNDGDGFADCEDGECASASACENDADADADTDADSDADGDTDTDTDSDSDSDSDTDTDADLAYDGAVDAILNFEGQELACVGSFVLDVRGGGAAGSADCFIDEVGFELVGELDGRVSGTSYEGVWIVEGFGEPVEVAMEGRATSTLFEATLFGELQAGLTLEGTMEGRP